MSFILSRLIICLLILFHKGKASTHWIVTEDGRIQAQMDSVFSLKRPYDLVALMQQEKRAILIEELKQQLMTQKEEIDRREDKETNLEGKIYNTDEDCTAAEKPLTDFDLYSSTVVPFTFQDFVDEATENSEKISKDTELVKPNCTDAAILDFSMHAFEHLEGVRDRQNLSMLPEDGLYSVVSPADNIDVYGHLIQEALQQNKTSWINYNMAAYYWRTQGNATNAIECVRRALHYSPREFKYIALINLGNILHHSRHSEEAAIVVRAAVDNSPDIAISHFTLGNIYAVLADYNKSATCFENTLKIQPDFESAEQRNHAVKCHSKLEKALEEQHISLQRTLTELREYQKQHEYWLRQHEKLLSEQAPPEVKLEQRLEYEEQKIRESLDGRAVAPMFMVGRDMNPHYNEYLLKLFGYAQGQDCFQFEQNGHMVLSCNMRREAYQSIAQAQVDLSLNLQLIQAVESRAGRLGQKMAAKVGDQCHRT